MLKSGEESNKDRILIVAAEASACMYASRFIAEWKKDCPQASFFGVGDKAMSEDGMECLGYAEDMAVMGLLEVAQHFNVIKKCFHSIVDSCKENPPKYAILIDYPGFNMRLAKKLKSMGIPVVYYVSPQLWAWKKGRVEQVRKYVDHMLVVFPFEVDFYKQQGIEAHFVGHPLLEVIDDEQVPLKSKSEVLTLGLMPGSRNSEVSYNFLVQVEAALELSKKIDIRIKVLVAPTLDLKSLKEMTKGMDLELEYIQGKPTQMINPCDILLTASGTATLQVALCEKPMVVMYKMNAITGVIAKFLVNTVDYFCIVNLIAGKEVVPEYFQKSAQPRQLSQKLYEILSQQTQYDQMVDELKRIRKKLGDGKATENVVHFLKEQFGEP